MTLSLYAAAILWNAVAMCLKNSERVDDFGERLKTYIFRKYFCSNTQPTGLPLVLAIF